MHTEIAAAVKASDIIAHVEGDREWITVVGITTTDAEGYAWIKSTMAHLNKLGWKCTANSVGSRFVPDYHHESRVWAERGHGPRTAYEQHMIATCTGRD